MTGLEPATSGVTGQPVSKPNQGPFRKGRSRNDAAPISAPGGGSGTLAAELRDIAARLRGTADAFRSSPDRMLETRHDAAARLTRIAAELETGAA